MIILAFESSCDETAAAVVQMDEAKGIRRILSSAVASQIAVHALYGGVVPEIASRAHAEAISGLTDRAMSDAGVSEKEIDAVAVTSTPGLIGPLLVGVNYAKALAYAWDKPLIAVNHIKGHVAACYPFFPDLKPPFTAMVVSGSHSSLLEVSSFTDYRALGLTRDDAAGEAFDKVARVLGLPYPGGAEMDRLASLGNPRAIALPSVAVPGDTLDFSFSGIKTAVVNYANTLRMKGEPLVPEDLAASFTRAVTDGVSKRLREAYDRRPFDRFVLAGGVSANSHLRAAVAAFGKKRRVKVYFAPPAYCTDNAAMIGVQAYYEALAGNYAGLDLNPSAVCDI
ncbi:MAG: tRNA (adenosine(37)-N6)-threonylcarbamoyltransferase complex transferase subunit TsaD [Clostridia bacterium]|nr:tRNA (adenosine(37)-N6)-threonylcarbamoyltransferase complex transferase subunit TsaD [Clostridia bacterium]